MITSYLVENRDELGRVFAFYDSVAEGKHIFTACGVGSLTAARDDAALTQLGRDTLLALCAYADNNRLKAIRFVEIATVAAASIRVRKAITEADDKDVVFFVCRSDLVYDAAFLALNPQWVPPTVEKQ